MELTGKNVFITGSTRGIGKAVALAFAKEGANIVLNGRSEITPEQRQEIEAFGVKCIGFSGDISDFDAAGEMIQATVDQLGSIDILVNNAGITNDKLLLRMTKEDFNACLDINLVGTFNMTQQAVKRMMKQRSGRIINMASVVGFTKSVAREVAPRGITCNAIAPGFIQTEMTDVLSEKVKTQMNAQIPLQTFGQVEDVAATAIFLAKSPYITGQVVNVDGGLVMHG